MKKRVILIAGFIIIVILTVVVLESTTKIDLVSKVTNKSKTNIVNNTNENVIKDAKLKELDLTNISLSYVKGEGSTFSVSLTNNTNEVINIESFNITFKDETGNTIAVVAAYVGGNVDPNQVNSIKVTAKEDLSNAASVEYSL